MLVLEGGRCWLAGRWACGGRTVHGAEKGDSARLVQRPGGTARGRRQPAGGPGQSAGVRAARRGAGGWGQARSGPRRCGSVRGVRGERATLGRAGSGRGEGLDWWASGMGFGLGQVCFLLFPSSFLFLIQTKPNYLNPNSNLNSNPSTQTNKRDVPA